MVFKNILANDMIRIPMASVIFMLTAYFLISGDSILNQLADTSVLKVIGAVVCVVAMVYSIMLFMNIRISILH